MHQQLFDPAPAWLGCFHTYRKSRKFSVTTGTYSGGVTFPLPSCHETFPRGARAAKRGFMLFMLGKHISFVLKMSILCWCFCFEQSSLRVHSRLWQQHERQNQGVLSCDPRAKRWPFTPEVLKARRKNRFCSQRCKELENRVHEILLQC